MGATSRILQRLYSLDTSSPDFLRHLYCLIEYDEKEQYLTKLKEPELTRLLDFLDKVRVVSHLVVCLLEQYSHRPSMQSRQTTTLPGGVWISYKLSAAIMRLYRLRISSLANLPEWAMIRSRSISSLMCGKALMATRKSLSSL